MMRMSSSSRLIGMFCVSLFLVTSLALADEVVLKAPIPDAAALSNAIKVVDEVHKDDIAAAKTPDQKTAQTQSLIDAAKEEKDNAARFALLSRARDIAAGAGSYQTASAAADAIDATFSVDALKMKADAAAVTAKTVRTPDQKRQLVAGARDLADQAILADRYDVAKPAADIELSVARATSDPALVKSATLHGQQVRDSEAAIIGAKQALAVLADKPSDPDANLKVGKFKCFMKGDWKGGLPMLALGNDAALKALAEKDMAGATTADEQVKLADAWWDLAGQLAGITAGNVHRHSAAWYGKALPSISGLAKAKVEKRLAAAASNATAAKQKVVNLLHIVKPAQDSVEGAWSLKGGVLRSGLGATTRLQFPYHPPAEYDFRIELTPEQGNGNVVMVLCAGGRQFLWAMLGHFENEPLGFGEIHSRWTNGVGVKPKPVIKNGRRYEVVVQVRIGGVRALLDGNLISELKTDYSDVTVHGDWNILDGNAIGIGTGNSPTSFSKVEVVEVFGHGEFVQEKATAVRR